MNDCDDKEVYKVKDGDDILTVGNPHLNGEESGGRRRINITDMFHLGTISNSVVSLFTSAIGSNNLSVPWAFMSSGLILSLGFSFLSIAISYLSLIMYVKSRFVSCAGSLEDLSVKLYGKAGLYITNIMIILLLIGGVIGDLIAAGDTISTFIPQVHRRYLILAFWGLIILPLSYIKKLGNLVWSSFLSLFLLAVFFSIMIYFLASNIYQVPNKNIKMATISFNIFQSIPIILYSISNQFNIYDVHSELNMPSENNIVKVSIIASGFNLLTLVLFGTLGYLTFGSHVQGNLLTNLDFIPGYKPLIIITHLCIIFNIILALPLATLPIKSSIKILINENREQKSSLEEEDKFQFRLNIALTIIICAFILVFALFVSSIEIIFQFVGGIPTSYIMFILPASGIVKYRSFAPDYISKSFYISSIIFIIFGVIIAIGSTIIAVIDLI